MAEESQKKEGQKKQEVNLLIYYGSLQIWFRCNNSSEQMRNYLYAFLLGQLQTGAANIYSVQLLTKHLWLFRIRGYKSWRTSWQDSDRRLIPDAVIGNFVIRAAGQIVKDRWFEAVNWGWVQLSKTYQYAGPVDRVRSAVDGLRFL